MTWTWKKPVLCLIAIGFAAAPGWMVPDSEKHSPGATYSQFLREVRPGSVESVTIAPQNSGVNPAAFRANAWHAVRTVLPRDYHYAVTAMEDSSVNIEIKAAPPRPLMNAIPFLFLLGCWHFMLGKLRFGTRIA